LRGNVIGVDVNEDAILMCQAQGFSAYTPDDFHRSPHARPEHFDSLLMAHVLEHVTEEAGDTLLREYLPFVKPGGTVMLICPQERGFASDPTHIRWVDQTALARHLAAVHLEPIRRFSFPFPRWMGKPFIYNEFIAVAKKPNHASVAQEN
jgi:predicted SAM-dependent methyltransferase